ncbi:MAG: B12-binding domain-containing radical SAM protein [Oligoflexia bacterium]|nr:B12-binding domain-containing radical SAM protein [Oligoflexia bacterium]
MKRKVLLVIPVYKNQNMSPAFIPPQIGLASIAAVLLKNNYTVEIFDGEINPSYDAFKKKILDFQPELVGFTAYTKTVMAASICAQIVKDIDKKIQTVIGGPHATMIPQQTLEEFSAFDLAVIREGENTIIQILETNYEIAKIAQVAGISYRQNGQVITNPPVSYVDLDSLPFPAWDLFKLKTYNLNNYTWNYFKSRTHELFITVTRGCPFACTFCCRVLETKVRKRAVSNIISEIKWLIEIYKVRSLSFSSDTFTYDENYVIEICQAMIAEGLHKKISWTCSTRIDCLNEKLLRIMKSAGCQVIMLGLETSNQENLNAINKRYDNQMTSQMVNLIRSIGIIPISSFILGLPFEDKKSISNTIKFASKLKLGFALFTIFTPFPGTKLAQELQHNGRIKTFNWSKYDTQSSDYTIINDKLEQRDLMWLHLKGYLKFYFNYRNFLKIFRTVKIKSVPLYLLKFISYNR